MRFRLVYEGQLLASGRDPECGQRHPMAEHKQTIRKAFHWQLKELWRTSRFLAEHQVLSRRLHVSPGAAGNLAGRSFFGNGTVEQPEDLVQYVASNFHRSGYRFVPLVCEEFSLLCNLDIMFLRRDYPAGVISAGDLDNRVKTLIDTLRMPKSGNELRGNETPAEGEDPFFCLLEDDDLVTGLTVQTDLLLDPSAGNADVKLIISVELKPNNVTMFNLGFS